MYSRMRGLVLSCVCLLVCSGCQKELTVQSVRFEETPRDVYVVGDQVDESWNQLRVRMSDGSFEYISGNAPGVQIEADTSTSGEKTATVSYGGKSTTFSYTVYERQAAPVSIVGGEIQGYKDGDVQIYKGIPYAASTAGENRWKLPQDAEPWEGILDCTSFGDSCPQIAQPENAYNIPKYVGMSEDCLSLNIWTTGEKGADLPVIVFVHGGGAVKGGSSIPVADGVNMAKKGVVFVTVNYRLGAFGSLVAEELASEKGAGNLRYLDVVKALEWIQENIDVFGGDAQNVTLCGQSAGSRLVSVLLASPLTEGLFSRAVMFSASAVGTDFPTAEEYIAQNTLSTASVTELRMADVDEIVKLETNKMALLDGYLLRDDIEGAYAKGMNADVDILMCVVTGDVGILLDESQQNALNPLLMLVGQQELMAEYRRSGGSTGSDYVCLFEYAMNGANICEHTDDLPFWFCNPVKIYDEWDAEDYAFAEVASTYLVNFASTGNPNGEGLSEWEPASDDFKYLHILQDASCKMEQLSSEQMETVRRFYKIN